MADLPEGLLLPAEDEEAARDRSATALVAARSGRAPRLRAVARPKSTQEVAELLRWAQETRAPVVARGGGSGVCRGVEADGFVVVDLSALNNITGIDEESRLVTAQAGVTGPQVTRFLAERGYTLGHEPQSIDISTVGGWIATRACGQLSARFGGIETMVAGLEAVLPGGHTVTSKPSPRRAAGPDVASLMIGSEGSLGIVTEATLRFSPLPQGRADRCLSFDNMAPALEAVRTVAQSGLSPTLVRLYDPEDTALLLLSRGDSLEGPLLLLSFDGYEPEDRAGRALEMCAGVPQDPALVAHWWEHRNDAVRQYAQIMAGEGVLGPHGVVDTMEVSAPWSRIEELYGRMKEALSERADLCACHLSHVYGDGACLYFTVAAACEAEEEAVRRLESWWQAGMSECLAAGGSISHHHGIGRLKARWLPEELDGFYDVLRAVKTAVDPHGIMNPGVLGL
ncbi:MAG TPA: FAD-binding oxidoreductase [Actinomycetota bacterium]|nr:FAD-binding oxidoreductase [Actinomycetota bacterium]